MKKLFAAVFVAATLGAAVANVAEQGRGIREDFSYLAAPFSFAALRRDAAIVEATAASRIAGMSRFIDTYSSLQTLMGKEAVGDFAVVKAENGSLDRGSLYPRSLHNLREYATRAYMLKRFVVDRNGKLLFLNPPNRVIKGVTVFRPGMPYLDLNPLQESFLHHLREYNIEYLDARANLRRGPLPPEKWFFRTDFTWTAETCFEVFLDLIAKMNQTLAANLDPDSRYRNRDNYVFQRHGPGFLGNLGRHAGESFSGLDEFTLIRPKATGADRYSLEFMDAESGYQKREGDAEETLFHSEALSLPRDLYVFHPFDFYGPGLRVWSKITNLQNPTGPKLLLIHDGYGAPLACFLAPMFGEVHTIWSSRGKYSIDINQYLVDHRFDYVVLEISPDGYNDDSMNFFIGAKR